MKRILIILGLLLSSTIVQSTYNVGTIDSISGTNNGGTGYGNATQADAVGYVTPGFTDIMQLFGSAVQPDGKTVVAGWDATTGMAIVARYNINGTEDATFNPGPGFYVTFLPSGTTNAQATGVTVLPNGKIIIVGTLTITSGSRTAFFVAQFLPNGALDTTSFGGGNGYTIQNITVSSEDVANAVTVDSLGNIYVIGTSTQLTFGNVFIAQYNSTGALVTGYNSGAVVGGGGAGTTIAGIALLSISITSLTGEGAGLDANGNIVVCGSAGSALLVARFDGAGVLDTTGFNSPNGYNTQGSSSTIGYGVGFQSTGKIIVAGFDNPNVLVLRYTTDGLLDRYANNPASPFGIGGAGSQTGYITSSFGGSFATAYGVAIQSDDTIVIGGTTTISGNQSLLVARYVADGSSLDTSFSTDGFTTTYVGSLDNGNSLSMQQNGSFIVAGTYTSTHPNFITARYLGNIPQGCMDYTYNPAVASSPGTPGFRTYPTDTTATDLPKVTAIYPAASGTLYVLSSEANSSTNSQLVKLSSTGSTASTAVVIAEPTPHDVITDSQNRAVVVGTGATNGFIARYTSTGAMTIDGAFAGGTVVDVGDAISLVRVCEQGSSRLVAIGQLDAGIGIVIGYTESGALDALFGNSLGYSTEGSGDVTFNDIIIDANNGIYIAYQVASGGNIWIEKFSSNGAALDDSFATNTNGQVDTGLVSASYTTPCLSFDNNGKIVVATTNISTGTIVVQSYNPTSAAAPIVNSCSITTATTLLSTPVITKLQCDTNNRLIFTGYDMNDFFIGRLVLSGSTYILDTTFAPYASCPGILKTMYSTNDPSDGTTPARVSNSVCINTNGAILFGGYENNSSTATTSLVGQVVGNTGGTVYTQVNRYPSLGAIGTINTSFGTNGALDLNVTTSVPHGQPMAMNVLATGKILMADANGTDTILSQLTSAYVLDTGSFGSTTGSITLTGLVTPTAIMVDTTAANYYILGSDGAHGVVYKVNAAGTSGGTVFVTTTLTSAYAITQQASGRILIAGYDSTHSGGSGVIVAYTPTGALDTSFNPTGATPGYWYTGIAHPIMSISVGATSNAQLDADKIFFAYQNGSSAAVVARLLENGTALDSNFTFGTAIASVSSDTEIKMQLDASGKIVLVANTGATAGIQAARYTAVGANNVAAATIIADTSSQVLENILTLSDSTTLILAAVPNATPTSAFMTVAQLTTSFVLDPAFNAVSTPGYLTTNVPSSSYTPVMDDFYALDVISTGGILISGDNSQTASSADPYITQIIARTTPTKVSQSATSLGAAGTLDTTYNSAGSTAGFMNLGAELQSTQLPAATTARALLQKSNGTYYIAGSTSSNSYVTLMSDDDVQNTTFGRVTIAGSGKTNVSSMLLGQDGNVLVAGAGAGTSSSGWLVNLNATTGAVVFTASTTLDSHYAIAQQSNGRILVAGIASSVGAIIAYNSVTGAVDTTFGVNGIYTATGYGAINSMVVDSSNNIYCIANDTSNNAKVIKLGVNGTATSGWTIPIVTTNSTIAVNNHLAFNNVGEINAVAVDTVANEITLSSYNATAGGTPSISLFLSVGGTGITTPNVTDLLIDLNANYGKAIMMGYDSSTSPNTPFIIRTTDDQTSLDGAFNITGVQTYNTLTSGVTTNWYAGMINADGKITVAGYASALTTPYTMRVYGDEFVGQFSPSLTPLTAGTPGTIDTSFGTSGVVELAGLSGGGSLAGSIPQVIMPISNGDYYVALNNSASTLTQVIRLTNSAILDTSFSGDGFATNIAAGVTDMILDGSNRLVVIGNQALPTGWIARYVAGDAGTLDPTFFGGGIPTFDPRVLVYKVVQQTLGRYVLAGNLSEMTGKGGLVGVVSGGTSAGIVDTTFGVNGYYDTGVTTTIHAVISDVYDRLIIAYENGAGAINIQRLTSAGQLDTTFGTAGTITGAIALADDVAQVCLAFDASGNIVVATHTSTPAIAVKAYANGTGTTVIETQLNITTVITNTPVLTNMIATADGKILLSGYQSTTNPMWVARVKDNGSGAYILDTTFGGGDGIMIFSFDAAGTVTGRALNSIAMYGDGQIAMVGTETDSANTPNISPFLSMAYNTPYTTQELFCQDSKPDGTNDMTLGASSATSTALGVTFFASSGAAASSGQVARAIALQDDANIVVAVDGGLTAGSVTPSDIFISMFNVDGLLNTAFNSTGYATVLNSSNGYANQKVNDMVTFTTIEGIHKAIIAGYAHDTALGITGSLLLQYNLTTPGLDTANFGGFNNSPDGIAFGDAQQAFVVGQQTNGRIIIGGLTQDNAGVLLGYTSAGKLDMSFGNDGYQSSNTGTTGIYSHAIDPQNRIVIAYKNGGNVVVARILADGSGLDTTFNVTGTTPGIIDTADQITGLQTGINNNFKVVVDGSGNIIVAAITGNGTTSNQITVYSYISAGTSTNATVTYIGGTSFAGSAASTFTIGRLLVDEQGNVVVVAYDSNPSPDTIVVTRLVPALTLDPTFNGSGYLTYHVASGNTQIVTDALIHPDGRILIVGSEQ